ncbi:unnamed protein product, partial [Ectocarpus sp. 4 AP-2014]
LRFCGPHTGGQGPLPPPLASNPWHPGGSPSIYSQAARSAHLIHTPSRPRRSKSRAAEGRGSRVRVEGGCGYETETERENCEAHKIGDHIGSENKEQCARVGYVRGVYSVSCMP